MVQMIDTWSTEDKKAWNELKEKERNLEIKVKEQLKVKPIKATEDVVRNWKKVNVVRKEALIPKKDYEWFNKKLKDMGMSYNKWVNSKIQELKENKQQNRGMIYEKN